jgi:Helix-turn-helix domain
MASIGLSEAARLTGRNQSTIHRAMKTGKLAYAIGEGGERRIDTSELDRVFGIKINGATPGAMAQSLHRHVAQAGEIALLQQHLEDREETIRDLRTRLDASEGERRTVQARLDAVLTDQRARRSWWPWGRQQ